MSLAGGDDSSGPSAGPANRRRTVLEAWGKTVRCRRRSTRRWLLSQRFWSPKMTDLESVSAAETVFRTPIVATGYPSVGSPVALVPLWTQAPSTQCQTRTWSRQ